MVLGDDISSLVRYARTGLGAIRVAIPAAQTSATLTASEGKQRHLRSSTSAVSCWPDLDGWASREDATTMLQIATRPGRSQSPDGGWAAMPAEACGGIAGPASEAHR
ncbi:hypothetical protein RJ55_02746 [Drechmeria coniospora]|nr:hypothetical protein RJ55_02746 [Drechmeria coniospora]